MLNLEILRIIYNYLLLNIIIVQKKKKKNTLRKSMIFERAQYCSYLLTVYKTVKNKNAKIGLKRNNLN